MRGRRVIAGAGPAGAAAALNLAPRRPRLLVERRAESPPRIGESLPAAARRPHSRHGLARVVPRRAATRRATATGRVGRVHAASSRRAARSRRARLAPRPRALRAWLRHAAVARGAGSCARGRGARAHWHLDCDRPAARRRAASVDARTVRAARAAPARAAAPVYCGRSTKPAVADGDATSRRCQEGGGTPRRCRTGGASSRSTPTPTFPPRDRARSRRVLAHARQRRLAALLAGRRLRADATSASPPRTAPLSTPCAGDGWLAAGDAALASIRCPRRACSTRFSPGWPPRRRPIATCRVRGRSPTMESDRRYPARLWVPLGHWYGAERDGRQSFWRRRLAAQ